MRSEVILIVEDDAQILNYIFMPPMKAEAG